MPDSPESKLLAQARRLTPAPFVLLLALLSFHGLLGPSFVPGRVPAFATAALAQTPLPSEDPGFEAWLEVEQFFQREGPVHSLARSRDAVLRHPSSLSLSSQHMKIWIAGAGFDSAEAALDTLRREGYPTPSLQAARITIAIERGDDAATAQLLGELSASSAGQPDPSSFDGFQILLLEAAVASRSNSPGAMVEADSLLDAASSHAILRPRSGFAGAILELQIRREHAGNVLRHSGIEASLPLFDSILATAKDHGFREFALRTAFALARAQLATGRIREAEELLNEALPWSRTLQDRRLEALLYNYLGRCLQDQRRFGEARDQLLRAAELLEGQGDPVASSWCLLGLGWSQYTMGETHEAESSLENALAYFQALQNPFGSFHALNNLGLVHLFSERLDSAEEYFEEALALVRGTQLESLAPLAMNNQAILYQRSGRLDHSSEVYRQLLEYHRASGELAAELRTLNNLALVTEQMGRSGEAQVLYRQCIERGLRQENFYAGVPARINLGRLLVGERDFEGARFQLEAALERALGSQDMLYIIDAHEALGLCFERMNQSTTALEHWNTADRKRAQMGQSYSRMNGQLRMARLQAELDDEDGALARIAVVESLSVLVGDDRFLASSHAERARLRLSAGHAAEARIESRLALDLLTLEGWKLSPPARNHERVVFYRALSVFVQAISNPKEIADAFVYAQRLKSRSLLEYLQEGQRPILPRVTEEVVESERALRATSDAIRAALLEPGVHRATQDSLRGALAETITEHQLVRDRILRDDPRFERAATHPHLTLDMARERLMADGTLVLDFLLPPDDPDFAGAPGVVFVLHAGGTELYLLHEIPRLRSRLALAVGLLGSRPNSPHDLHALRGVLRGLSDTLLAPATDHLLNSRELLISPDGSLSRLPFAALMHPESGPKASFLVESLSITVTPSLASEAMRMDEDSVSTSTGKRWQPRWDLAIWNGYYGADRAASRDGSPGALTLGRLPQAGREMRALQQGFDRTRAISLDRSTRSDRSAVAEISEALPVSELPRGPELLPGSELLGDSRILHFITHGYFDDLQPWRSGLYLWQSGNSTRKLEMADVYTMDFRCDLVTLSACQSARENLGPSLGLQGFTHALFASGARSVLATLWDIQDASASRFMQEYYGMLADGQTKSDALRATQLEFLKTPGLEHPFYWAPYLLQGDGRSTVPLTRRAAPLVSRSAALGVLLVLASLLALVLAWRNLRRSWIRDH